MANCKLELGFVTIETDSSLVTLAGFRTWTDDGVLMGGHAESDSVTKRIVRALSEGHEGAAALMASIRYAEEERTGYSLVQVEKARLEVANAELRTKQIESAIQKRALEAK